MANCSGIVQWLRSDKITIRAKGKKKLLEFISLDRIFVCGNDRQWWDIIRAVIEWECKELTASRGKRRDCDSENAVFVRQTMRHGLDLCHLSPKKCADIINHVLSMLCNKDLSQTYHNEHLSILHECLENMKFVSAIELQETLNVLNFMKGYVTERNVSSREIVRIMQGLAQTTLKEGHSSGIIPALLEWFQQLLQETPVSSPSFDKLLPALCDAHTTVLDLHGIDCVSEIFRYVDGLLVAISRVLPQLSVSGRDPLLRLLLSYIRTCCTGSCGLRLCTADPLKKSLNQLLEVVSHTDFLKGLMVHMRSQYMSRHSTSTATQSLTPPTNDTFVNYLEDTRFNLHLEVIASLTSAAASQSDSCTNCCPIHCELFRAIESSPSQFSHSGTHGNNYSQSYLSMPSSTSRPVGGTSANQAVVESRLYLLHALCTTPFRRYTLCPPCAHPKNDSNDIFLACELVRWVHLLRNQLFNHIRNRSPSQLCGAILTALEGIAIASYSLSVEHSKLRSAWSDFVETLIISEVTCSLLRGPVSRSSLPESLLKLLTFLLESKLLHEPAIYALMQHLWANSACLRDLRLVESCCFFQLLSHLLLTSSSIEAVRSIASASFENSTDECGTSSTNNEWLAHLHEGKPVRGVLCATLWLDSLLEAPSNQRVSALAQVPGYIYGLKALAATSLGLNRVCTDGGRENWECIFAREMDGILLGRVNWCERSVLDRVTAYASLQEKEVESAMDCAGSVFTPNAVFESATTALDMLCVLYRRVEAKAVGELSLDETVEHVTSWQLVSLFLAAVYIAIAEAVGSMGLRNERMEHIVRDSLKQFWLVMRMIFNALSSRPCLLRGNTGSTGTVEYVSCCSALVARAACVGGTTRSINGSDNSRKYMVECCDEMLSYIPLVVNEAVGDDYTTAGSATSMGMRRGVSGSTLRSSSRDISDTGDDFDVFMECIGPKQQFQDMPSCEGIVSDISQTDLRLLFSDHQIHIVCSTAAAVVCSNPTQETLEMLLNVLTTVSDGGRKYRLPSEVALYIGERIGMVSSAQGVFDFVKYNTWEEDWGFLGYYKALCVIRELSFREEYFRQDDCSVVIEMIFPSNTLLQEYLVMFWRARVLQLECAARAFCLYPEKYKQQMGDVVLQSLLDIDTRVRSTGQYMLSLLFRFLKNHSIIYSTVRDHIDVDRTIFDCITLQTYSPEGLYTGEAHILDDCVVSRVLACTRCGMASRRVLHLALRDVLYLCGLHPQCRQDNAIHISPLSSVNDTLRLCVKHMARCNGYSSEGLLLRDHLEWIVQEWLKVHKHESEELCYKIQYFPFYIFGYDSLSVCLSELSSVIVPLICSLEPWIHRWNTLSAYAEQCGFGQEDSSLALILRQNIVSIKSREILLSSGFYNSPLGIEITCHSESDCKSQARYLKLFIDRMSNLEELQRFARKNLTDVVYQLLMLVAFDPDLSRVDDVLSGSIFGDMNHIVWYEEYEKQLTCLLNFTAREFQLTNFVSLVCDVNALYLLAQLRTHIRETRNDFTAFFLSCSVCYISGCVVSDSFLVTQDANGGAGLIYRSVIACLFTCIECFPQSIFIVINCVSNVVSSVTAFLKSKRIPSCSFQAIVPDMFAEILCLLYVITMKENNLSLNPTCAVRDGHLSMRYAALMESDVFCPDKCSEILHRLRATILEMLEWGKLDKACSVSMCLPLPCSVLSVVSADGFLCDSFKHQDTNSPNVVHRIEYFDDVVSAMLGGQLVAKGLIWLQLHEIKEMLQPQTCSDQVAGEALWRKDVDIVASFVASLLSLGNSEGIVEVSKNLQTDIAYVLGSLGFVDLHSIGHGKLMSRPIAEYDPQALKMRLLSKLMLSIWEGGTDVARASLGAIRNVQFTGCMASYVSDVQNARDSFLSVTSILSKSLVPFHYEYQRHSADQSSEAWSSRTWSTAGKDYDMWLKNLVATLLSKCYCGLQENSVGPPVSAVNTGGQSKSSLSGSDVFLSCFLQVSKTSTVVAECLFPLILFDLLSHDDSSGRVAEKVGYLMRTHLFSKDCTLPAATRIGCDCMVFILRQNISKHIENSLQRNRKRPLESQKSSRREDTWSLPYSTGLNIDYKIVAEAALRCGYVCTAELFVELAAEAIRGDVVQHSISSRRSLINGDEDNSIAHLADLQLRIYKDVHNPDAIFGVTQSSDLSTQALVYSHTGQWTEALAAYDCIAQCGGIFSRAKTDFEAAQYGTAQSLHALGYRSVLQRYISAPTFGSEPESSQSLLDSTTSALSEQGVKSALHLSQWSCGTMHQIFDSTCAQKPPMSLRSNVNNYDFISSSITAALRDICSGDRVSSQSRIDACIRMFFPRVTDLFQEETSKSMMIQLADLQQLVEVGEAISLVNPRNETDLHTTLSHAPINAESLNKIINSWRGRLSCTFSDSVFCETILSLRLSILFSLLGSRCIEFSHFLLLLDQVHDAIDSKNAAHALSPILYKIRGLLETSSGARTSTANVTNVCPFPTISVTSATKARYAMQEARLLWSKGLHDVALNTMVGDAIAPLKRVLLKSSRTRRDWGESEDSAISDSLSEAYRISGNWLSSKKGASGSQIVTSFFMPAVKAARSVSQKVGAHLSLARFNLHLHHTVKNRVGSAEWIQGKKVSEDRKYEYEQCLALYKAKYPRESAVRKSDKAEELALKRHMVVLKKELSIDAKEREAVENSVQDHLINALKNYKEVLALSKESDMDTIFHVINIWFQYSESKEVNDVFRDIVSETASFKFVSLTYQIMSRLDGSGDAGKSSLQRTYPVSTDGKAAVRDVPSPCASDFQSVLRNLLFALCRDHPYHTLPQLFALVNEKLKLDNISDGYNVLSSTSTSGHEGSTRIQAARGILHRLNSEFLSTGRYANLVESMDLVFRTYIELSLTSVEQCINDKKTKDVRFTALHQYRGKVPFHQRIGSVRSSRATYDAPSTCIPVLTRSQAIHADCDYSDAVFITGFADTFSLTDSGLSRPKIIKCEGSDGRIYTQLVKGGDDTRQDAVMEQVFDHVNVMLRTNKECRKRNLSVRTYKIIPMTQQSGIIEWVENTVPFGTYLCDKPKERLLGAHSRYFPQDISHLKAREKFADAKDNKEAVFNDICAQFHPAFRFFFLENFPDPSVWLSSRVAYTRTTAATSMVGYVLGIGDRHSHNILIDYKSAEVIHIDFGIMFEQGKALGTPETVPFRLTRDIVDGMGICGCEGTFRRCCEEVLKVLRANSSQLLTILEVVIHDPLYKWSLSPIQARKRQRAEGDSVRPLFAIANDTGVDTSVHNSSSMDAAQRALLRIKDKLQGYEDPSGESLSVEGQVELLINEAIDPKNLCMLFQGWAPWL